MDGLPMYRWTYQTEGVLDGSSRVVSKQYDPLLQVVAVGRWVGGWAPVEMYFPDHLITELHANI